eukprot:438405_1
MSKQEHFKQKVEIVSSGARRRAVGGTKMNADSSRSHLITSILIQSEHRLTSSVATGKLSMVDLAGSERAGKSGATGEQLKEAQSINKSLSSLGDVISALTKANTKHVPFRNHPLTMLMSDSLGGNSKTLMFVCTSPADYNVSETSSALQFAQRCREVHNTSADVAAAQAQQIRALRRELEKAKVLGTHPYRVCDQTQNT